MEAVLDTNVVLDLFLFADPATSALRAALGEGRVRWIATPPMRDELARVLTYPLVQRQLASRGGEPQGVLRAFDGGAALRDAPSPCAVRCVDEDDQMFIDLAVAHGALLLSRDREVLRLRRRLADFGVEVASAFAP